MALGRKTGGRKAGKPNRSTEMRQAATDKALAVAFREMGADAIRSSDPATVLEVAYKGLLVAGLKKPHLIQSALALAKEAAPYFNAKLASSAIDVRGKVTLEQLVSGSLVAAAEMDALTDDEESHRLH